MPTLRQIAAHHPEWNTLSADQQELLFGCFGEETYELPVPQIEPVYHDYVRMNDSARSPKAELVNVRVVFFDVKRFLYSVASAATAVGGLYFNPYLGLAALINMVSTIERQSTKELSDTHARILAVLAAKGCEVEVDEDELYNSLCNVDKTSGRSPTSKAEMVSANTRLADLKIIDIEHGRVRLRERITFSKV
jgi:hypothetical protein